MALLLSAGGQPPAFGQGAGLGNSLSVEPTGVSYPSPDYYRGLEIYRTGELDRAYDAFEFAAGRARKDINGLWIDSIPVRAMMAECQYRMGDLEGAMQNLDLAMRIVARYRGWLSRPVWDEVMMTPTTYSPKSYLWPEANSVNRLPIARALKFYSGERITEGRLAQGGRIEELNIKTIDVVELLRGIAIASYRRRIILGPLSEGDPLALGALESTKYPAGLSLPIARSLIGSMRAAERFGAMQDERAITDAVKNSTFNGGVHALSPITGLCAASAIAGSDKPTTAIPICLSVSNQAAALESFEWIGEALQLAAGCSSPREAPIVQQAGQVAASKLVRKCRLAALHCLIASADAAVTAGDLQSATARLNEAKTLSSRRDVMQPRLEAYGAYVAARLATRSSASADGGSAAPWDAALSQLTRFATQSRIRKRNLISMPRLYQLERVRRSLGSGSDAQSADILLAGYSADPALDVWRRDPVDAISGLIADRDSLRVTRLRTAASRESGQDVLARMEDVQSARIRNLLPLGGRVMELRALSRLPDELLEKGAIEYRNTAAQSIRDLRTAAKKFGDAAPVDPATLPSAENTLIQLERGAWSIALDRQLIPHTMPHPMDQRQPAAAIPDETAILAFFQDNTVLHVVLCTKAGATYWAIKGATRVGTEIAKVLKGVGASHSRGARLPEDDSWKEDAIRLRDRLIMPATGPLLQDRLAGIKHLVVIPDGLLWYLPFEILPTEDETSPLLGDAIRISYAATPSLAMYPTALETANPVTAVTAGKMFAPRDLDANNSLVQSIVDSIAAGSVVRLPEDAAIPTRRSGELAGHLLVGEITTPDSSAPLKWPLAAYESSLPLGGIGSWFGYPPVSPSSVILPGFRSNLDTSQAVSGNEMMLTIAALQYGGVRDVILSRWAVGGESTAMFLREYAQEVPFIGPAKAIRRAKSVLRRSELSPSGEPTLVGSDQDRESLTGDEPLFWSTYLHAAPLK